MSQESFGLGDNTLKVLTFAGPLFASSLAITYDVGFFVGVGIGFFSFFGLSEHLVFALQSLPFAIPPVLVILFWFTSGWYSYRSGYQDGMISNESGDQKLSAMGSLLKRIKMNRPTPWLMPLWLATTLLFIWVCIWNGGYAIAFLLACLIIYVTKIRNFHAAWESRLPVLMVACAFAALILSFLIGLQQAHAIRASKDASETIGVDDKLLPARLIRGGDKGILFFSLDSKKVRFLRWDSIKQIETL